MAASKAAAPRTGPRVVLATDIEFWDRGFGSHTRIIGLLNALSETMDVVVFLFRSLRSGSEAAIRALTPRVRVVSYKQYEEQAKARPAQWAVGRSPFFAQFRPETWATSLALYLEASPADAVIVEYLKLAFLVDGIPPGTTKVLDMHDVMAQRRLSFAHFGRKPSIAIPRAEENAIIDAFDLAIAITHEDARMLAGSLRRAMLIVAPHGAEVSAASPVERREAGTVLFVGAETPPNIDGLHWFLDQVWPAAPQGSRLLVAGDVCRRIKTDHPGIELLGRVDDLAAFYARGVVAINPVHYGGGMKIKTLEAVAHGVPVVATREAAKGLRAGVGRSIQVASCRAEFLGHMALLIEDESRAEAARQACREDAAGPFSAARSFSDLVLALQFVALRG